MVKHITPAALVIAGVLLVGGCAPSQATTATVVPTIAKVTPLATATPASLQASTPTKLPSPQTVPTVSPVATMSPVALKPATPSVTTNVPVTPSVTPASAIASTPSGSPTEQPVAAETNPVGDIPDTQAFVKFSSSTGGYAVDVPEGWARTDQGTNARFVSKLDGVEVALADASVAPTAATARANEVAKLEKSGHAVQITQVQDVKLPSGSAVLVDYSSNSLPDPVTGKQVRLENNAYYFFKNGKLATLTLWAPLGADNVDQWHQIAASFRWQ